MTHACAHCGGRVADEAERCPSCGSSQRITVQPVVAPLPDPPPPHQAPAPRPKQRGPGVVVQLAIVAGVLGVLGVGAVVAGALFAVGPSGPATGGSGTPVPTPSAASGGLAAVKARGTLRVAADPDAAPFLSKTASGWEGFEYGVMSAVAAEAGVKLEIVEGTFSELPDKVASGAADLAIGQLSPSSAWPALTWSVSYLQYSLCLVVPTSSKVKALADLRGKRVGMYDDPVATQITALGVGANYERVVYDDYGYFEALEQGKLDAVVYDCPLARHELRPFRTLRIADDALNVSTYNAAVRADDATLAADVSRVLKNLGDQGLLARLESQWLGVPAPTEGYATTSGRVVVVKRGESLQAIAARELGSADRWTELRDSNRDLVGNGADTVYAGLRLRLARAPAHEGRAGERPAERRRKRRAER